MEGEAIGAARCAVPAFPGSRAPGRTRTVNADGIRIAVHDWGEPDATPILLVHGALDFALLIWHERLSEHAPLVAFRRLLERGAAEVVVFATRGAVGDGDEANVNLHRQELAQRRPEAKAQR